MGRVGFVEEDQKAAMKERYSRQILFREIGRTGQEKLLNSRVLIVGCGALGASHAEMLSRAGVGKLRIVDRDFVEVTNLQRQTLFSESDAFERIPKAIAAKKRLLPPPRFWCWWPARFFCWSGKRKANRF